jgi:hypothetical protein
MNESENLPSPESFSEEEQNKPLHLKRFARQGRERQSETAVVPTNMDQVRALLSGRDPRFREPLTEREERTYRKVWRRRGKGFTKKRYASKKTKERKERQRKLNKWARKRQENRIERKNKE